ncbi:MAG: hypothetical protein ACI4TD_09075 [Phocaeicola sp.]
MSSRSNGSGIGVLGVLQIIFIVLKLCDVLQWSWWMVFIPAYISAGLTVILIVIAIIWDWR